LSILFLEANAQDHAQVHDTDIELLDSMDNDDTPMNPENQPDYGQNDLPGWFIAIAVFAMFALSLIGCWLILFMAFRCLYFDNCDEFFASFKKFEMPGNLIKYGIRLETENKADFTLIRYPVTTSINFELCSKLRTRMKLIGVNPSSPGVTREITICLPPQSTREMQDGEGSPQTDGLNPTRRETKIIDESGNQLAISMLNQKITTDSAVNDFRDYTISWENDVLSVTFQGRQIFMLPGLSAFFDTPRGQPFTPAFALAAPVVNDFIITEVLVSTTFQFGGETRGFLVSVDTVLGDMKTSKWGFQPENEMVGFSA